MLQSAKQMRGAAVFTPEGPLGTLADVLADVSSGEIAYAVVDPGGLLPHDALLAPVEAIKLYETVARRMELSISRDQVLSLDNVLNEVSLARSGEGDTFEARFRRLNRLITYRVVCKDGVVGSVSDFLADPDGWSVRYLVVDTHELSAEHEVLVPVAWISEIEWRREWVTINMTEHRFRQSQHLFRSA